MDTENHEICLLPGGQLLQAVQGQTLLEVFIGAGIFLRSDCGGKGLCGKCLVKIHDSIQAEALSSDETEIKTLGEKSLKSGFRLVGWLTR
jgi:ferredoxin